MIWRARDRVFDLGAGPLIMGIVNVTPDSFSDGGRHFEPAAAVERVQALIAEGADLIDLGAESTRPGAQPIPAAEQIRRLDPVLERIAATSIAISVDTADADVAWHALERGACVVNDVTALSDARMASLVADHRAGLVLMHMQGDPRTMQIDPRYVDVTAEVRAHLAERLARARAAGVPEDAIVLDPGIGFGKTAAHNFELLARLDELQVLGRPLLVGVSRKSFLGKDEGLEPEQRLEGGLAATAIAIERGASIVRTHDVRATRRAARIAARIRAARRAAPDSVAGSDPRRS
jgi:dihydropteroate synthase